jgi:hypothetical protein
MARYRGANASVQGGQNRIRGHEVLAHFRPPEQRTIRDHGDRDVSQCLDLTNHPTEAGMQSGFTGTEKSYPVDIVRAVRPQGLRDFIDEFLRGDVIPPLIGEGRGAAELAVYAIPVASLEGNRIDTQRLAEPSR